MKLKKSLPVLLLGCCSITASATDGGLVFSYDKGAGQCAYWGTEKREHYDVAIALNRDELAGTVIKGIEIPVQGADKMTDVKVWISSELKDSGKSGDLYSYDIDMDREFDSALNTIFHTLPQPLKIDGTHNVYVGFSFSISSLSAGSRMPLAVVPGNKDETYIKTASLSNLGKWKDLCIVSGMSSSVRVLLGDGKYNAACFAPMNTLNVGTGSGNTISVSVMNHGANGISSFSYDGKISDRTFSGTLTLDPPVANIFDASRQVQIPLPAIETPGNYTLELTIREVNGFSNEESTGISTDIRAFSILPVKRPLMEEYTAVSCGWCPKGMAAMDIMRERVGTDFIAVSFHTWGDPLDFYKEMPAGSGSSLRLPTAQIDRMATIDPYFGRNKDSFGLDKCWEEAAAGFAIAAVGLEGTLEGTEAVLNADVTFVYPVEDDAYDVEFFLVADGLTVPEGNQVNNFSKNEAFRGMEGLDKYIDSPHIIKDFAYNDAVVAWSGKDGGGAIPSLKEYETVKVSRTLAVPEVALDAELRGVAAVVDNATGAVINAIQIPLTSSHVEHMTEDGIPVNITYWNLMGMPVAEPGGICIRRIEYSDGAYRTVKIIKAK